jgi:hypothetical protein
MGRTFEILSDDQYSQNADIQDLQAFLSFLARVQMFTRSYAEYEEDSLYMAIDFILYDAERNILDLDHPELLSGEDANRVNAVQLNIPIGSFHGDERDQCYIDLALAIAHHLGWRLYDCDRGMYLEPSSS